MNLGRTCLFAALAVALGAYIFLVERPRMAAEAEPDRLVTFEPDRVDELALDYPSGVSISLSKTGGSWQMTAPLKTAADGPVVERLLASIKDLELERRIPLEDAEGLEVYGLKGQGSQARISIELDDGSALPPIVVGNTTPVGFSAFARLEGEDEVVVTPLLFHSGVKKNVFDLRNKRLFPVRASEAISLSIRAQSDDIELERAGNRWLIKEPIEDEADPGQVRAMLSSLGELKALAFFDDEEAAGGDTGLQRPQLEVKAEIGGAGMVGFSLGNTDRERSPAGVFLERHEDGQLAKVEEAVLVRFSKDLNSLRDKRVFSCEPSKISHIEFDRSAGDGFALRRGHNGTWFMDGSPATEVKQAIAARASNSLADLAGTRIVADGGSTRAELAPYGLDHPEIELSVTLEDGTVCGRVLASATDRGGETPKYFLKKTPGGAVMSVPEYIFSRLDRRKEDFLVANKKEAGDG